MANKQTRHQTRQEMRKKLRGWGMHEDEIEMCMVEVKKRQTLKDRGELPKDAPLCTRPAYTILRKEAMQTSPSILEEMDDSDFLPTKFDSVLTGVGRATGTTAKAVKRRKTLTKSQYDQEN